MVLCIKKPNTEFSIIVMLDESLEAEKNKSILKIYAISNQNESLPVPSFSVMNFTKWIVVFFKNMPN